MTPILAMKRPIIELRVHSNKGGRLSAKLVGEGD